MKEDDLGEPTSFFYHVFLGALKENVRQAKILKTFTEKYSNPGSLLDL